MSEENFDIPPYDVLENRIDVEKAEREATIAMYRRALESVMLGNGHHEGCPNPKHEQMPKSDAVAVCKILRNALFSSSPSELLERVRKLERLLKAVSDSDYPLSPKVENALKALEEKK